MLWPGGHQVLLRDVLELRQSKKLPIRDVDVVLDAGDFMAWRFDLPHAGGTTTKKLTDGSCAYADEVNFRMVMDRPSLFQNAALKRS